MYREDGLSSFSHVLQGTLESLLHAAMQSSLFLLRGCCHYCECFSYWVVTAATVGVEVKASVLPCNPFFPGAGWKVPLLPMLK